MNFNPLSFDHSLKEITSPSFRKLAFYLISLLVKYFYVLASYINIALQKTNADNIEQRFGVTMTPFSK